MFKWNRYLYYLLNEWNIITLLLRINEYFIAKLIISNLYEWHFNFIVFIKWLLINWILLIFYYRIDLNLIILLNIELQLHCQPNATFEYNFGNKYFIINRKIMFRMDRNSLIIWFYTIFLGVLQYAKHIAEFHTIFSVIRIIGFINIYTVYWISHIRLIRVNKNIVD